MFEYMYNICYMYDRYVNIDWRGFFYLKTISLFQAGKRLAEKAKTQMKARAKAAHQKHDDPILWLKFKHSQNEE